MGPILEHFVNYQRPGHTNWIRVDPIIFNWIRFQSLTFILQLGKKKIGVIDRADSDVSLALNQALVQNCAHMDILILVTLNKFLTVRSDHLRRKNKILDTF